MEDRDKTREPLIRELAELRQRLAEMKKPALENRRAEQRRPEEPETEDWHRSFIDQAEDGIYRIEYEPGIPIDLPASDQTELMFQRAILVEYNEAFARSLGKRRAEKVFGKRFFSDFDPESLNVRALAEAFASSDYSVEDQEVTLEFLDGDTTNLVTSIYGIVDSGELVAAWGITHDVTRQRRTDELLRRQSEALEQAFDGIAALDMDGRILFVNAAFAAMHGHQPEQLIGKDVSIFHTEEQMREEVTPFLELVKEKGRHRGDVNHRARDGTIFPTDMSVNVFRDVRGEPVGILGIARDVSQARRLEARLRQSQKMEAIGTLAGGIAHDFNNLLYAILGFVDLAKLDVPKKSRTFACLREITTAGKRAVDLVDRLLAFSRPTTEATKEPARFQPVIEEVLGLLRGFLPSTIELRESIDASCGPVAADAAQLHQIAMNLCTNAYHAMRERGGVLGVELDAIDLGSESSPEYPDLEPAKHLRLIVSDTGAGMDEKTVRRIFEPYFSTKEGGTGTGLGLSMVHGTVKDCGGAVSVDSEPGRGTRFTVLLPFGPREIDADEEEQIRPDLTAGNKRILFVDDEDQLVRWATMALEEFGYRIEAHSSSLEALELFRADPHGFDVVVADQTMPNLTGIELAREMLAIRPDIPIILCTGFSEIVSEKEALAAGIREYVRKPIRFNDLAEAISRVARQDEV